MVSKEISELNRLKYVIKLLKTFRNEAKVLEVIITGSVLTIRATFEKLISTFDVFCSSKDHSISPFRVSIRNVGAFRRAIVKQITEWNHIS